MANQVVLSFDGEENAPRYSIRQQVGNEAAEDKTTLKINPVLADHHGLTVDAQGFPTTDSLEAWHRKNNPHLFTD